MKIHRIRLKSGEQIEIHEAPNGSVCPVCGFIHNGELPYGWYGTNSSDNQSTENLFGAASFDVCPSCRVQYGNDDWSDTRSVTEMWDELRIRWLNRVGWTPEALSQLRENLGISEQALQHLAKTIT